MRTLAIVTLLLTVSGCTLSAPTDALSAYCEAQKPRTQAHAALLASEGTDGLQTTGRNVIAPTAALCGW